MKFVANRDDLLNGIRIVERATVVKGLQPVLANVLIETIGNSQIKLTATDFDLSITTLINATVETEGKFTLPAKKLGEIISRLNDELIKVELNGDDLVLKFDSSLAENQDITVIIPPNIIADKNNSDIKNNFNGTLTNNEKLPDF